MKEQLKIKIEVFEGILLTRFEQDTGISLLTKAVRDMRATFSLHGHFKRWLADYEKIKAARNPLFEKLVNSYFIDETGMFELTLASSISSMASASEINPMVDYINGLAIAIAYEQIQHKIIANLIDSTPNS